MKHLSVLSIALILAMSVPLVASAQVVTTTDQTATDLAEAVVAWNAALENYTTASSLLRKRATAVGGRVAKLQKKFEAHGDNMTAADMEAWNSALKNAGAFSLGASGHASSARMAANQGSSFMEAARLSLSIPEATAYLERAKRKREQMLLSTARWGVDMDALEIAVTSLEAIIGRYPLP